MTRKTAAWILAPAVCVLALYYFLDKTTPSKPALAVLGEDSSNLQAYSTLATAFQAQAGVPVMFQKETFEQAMLKANADFQSGRGAYDIVLQYNFSLAPYVRNNYVAKITDVYSPSVLKQSGVSQDVFPGVLRETSFYYANPRDPSSPSQQFGFPFAANTMLLVYNQRLFSDAQNRRAFRASRGHDLDVPTTWEQYMEIARFFSATPDGPKGVVVQGASDGWLYYELANYLFSLGTGTSKKQSGWEEGAPLTLASDANENALRYYKTLVTLSAGNYFTVGASQQRQIMLAEDAAMAIMWSDYIQPLATQRGSKGGSFGFAPIPGRISGLAGGAFYINRKTRQMQAAADFVLYALRPENQEKLLQLGLCSPLRSAYTSQSAKKVAYSSALRESLERGVFMFEAGTDAEIISDVVTASVQRFIRGELNAKETLATAEQEIVRKRLGST